MFKVKDIMATNVITISEDTGVYDAVKLLVDNNITGLPVVTKDMELIGIISEKDLLGALYDSNMAGGTVKDMVTRKLTSFHEDDDLADVCECMMKSSFRRVPIVSDGKLVGLVSRSDIMRFILKIRK